MGIDYPLPIEYFNPPAFGILTRSIKNDKPGRVRFQGTTWFARPYVSDLGLKFAKGSSVQLVARQGNTIFVLPSVHQLLDA